MAHPICVAVLCPGSSLEKRAQWYRDFKIEWTFRELLQESVLVATSEGDAFLDELREAGCHFERQRLVINADTVSVIDDLGNAVALDTRLRDLQVAFHDAQYKAIILHNLPTDSQWRL